MIGVAKAHNVACSLFQKKNGHWSRALPEVNCSNFCRDFRLKCEGLCLDCDERRANTIFRTRRPLLPYICNAGLVDFAFPVLLGTRVVAVLFGGQAYIDRDALPKTLLRAQDKTCAERARDYGVTPTEYQSLLARTDRKFASMSELGRSMAALNSVAQLYTRMLRRLLLTERIGELTSSISTVFPDETNTYRFLLESAMEVINTDDGGVLLGRESEAKLRYVGSEGFLKAQREIDRPSVERMFVSESGHADFVILDRIAERKCRVRRGSRSALDGQVESAQSEDSQILGLLHGRGLSSLLMVPMPGDPSSGVSGFCDVGRREGKPAFSPEDADYLGQFAPYGKLVTRLRTEFESLTKLILNAANFHSLVSTLIKQVLALMSPKVNVCSVFLWNDARTRLELVDTNNPAICKDATPRPGYSAHEPSLTYATAHFATPILIEDVHDAESIRRARTHLIEAHGCEKAEADTFMRRNGAVNDDDAFGVNSAQARKTGFLGVPLFGTAGSQDVAGVIRYSCVGHAFELGREEVARLVGYANAISSILNVTNRWEKRVSLTQTAFFKAVLRAYSHDLNNPRELIEDAITRLPDLTAGLQPAEEAAIRKVRENFPLLGSRIDALLEGASLDVADLIFDDTVRQAVQHFAGDLTMKHIRLASPSYGAQSIHVRVAPALLLQVVSEGFMNATVAIEKAKHPPGKGIVTVLTGSRVENGVTWAFVEIRDNGCGFSVAGQQTSLAQADVGQGGEGLGLLRTLVGQCRGTLDLMSNGPGTGAGLMVAFPTANGGKV